jgi:hypothetical protein
MHCFSITTSYFLFWKDTVNLQPAFATAPCVLLYVTQQIQNQAGYGDEVFEDHPNYQSFLHS